MRDVLSHSEKNFQPELFSIEYSSTPPVIFVKTVQCPEANPTVVRATRLLGLLVDVVLKHINIIKINLFIP